MLKRAGRTIISFAVMITITVIASPILAYGRLLANRPNDLSDFFGIIILLAVVVTYVFILVLLVTWTFVDSDYDRRSNY